MRLSHLCIHRPRATVLVAVALGMTGGLAYRHLAVAPLPRVDLPTLQITAALPGASPETMASSVATPLERYFGRISGLQDMTSTSSLGMCSLSLQFDLDRSADAAAQDVQAAIQSASASLPSDLPSQPVYRKVNPSDAPIMVLAFSSDTLPMGQIFDAANAVWAQKISQVSGVGQVMVGGGQQPAVRVQADPAMLAGLGLTLEDVRAVLSQASPHQPIGGFQGPQQAYHLALGGMAMEAQAYAPLVLAYKDGATVRLSDVADVIDSVENTRMAAWLNNQRAILMIIRHQPGANIIETVDRIQALLPRLNASISPAIDVQVALDRSQSIRASIHHVQITLVLTMGLVMGVIWVFLRSFSATLISSLAVPLTWATTFGIMYGLDYSLNNLTLMALILSTGLTVDDAIVVMENTLRHLEAGQTPFDAAQNAVDHVGLTLVSMAISLLAIFMPILCMAGVIGRLFREFAATLGISIAVSNTIALTILPALCAHFLRPIHSDILKTPSRTPASLRFFRSLHQAYAQSLRWTLRRLGHRVFVLIFMIFALGLASILGLILPKGLFPQQDTGLLIGFSEAPQDISFQALFARHKALNTIVQNDPDVGQVLSWIGASNAPNTGMFLINLKPLSVRHSPADKVIARLRSELASVLGIRLFLQPSQDINIGGRPSRTLYLYTLQGTQLEELHRWGPHVEAGLKKLPELKDVASDQQTHGLQASLHIDRDTASRLGITPEVVDDTLYDAFGQRQVSTLFTPLHPSHVILELKPRLARHTDPHVLLDTLYVPSFQVEAGQAEAGQAEAGPPVPLGVLTSVTTTLTPLTINHQGPFPAITFSFNVAPGLSLGQAVSAIKKQERALVLPASLHADFRGTAQAFQASMAREPLLIIGALLTIYGVLGILYESYRHPWIVLSTLPLAVCGALVVLWISHTDLSLIALMGILLLVGIVKKNAILILDFVLQAECAKRAQNVSSGLCLQAIYSTCHQACLLRFRPILMTTCATVFGSLPLALGSGIGSELRRPLGLILVIGLPICQALALYATPLVYVAFRRPRAHARLRRRR